MSEEIVTETATETAAYVPDPNSTLAFIREKLKREKDGSDIRNLSKLVQVEHRASSIVFLVAGMSRADYRQWRNFRVLEDAQHTDSGADKTDAPVSRDRSDLFLLKSAVLTSDGQKIDDEIGNWLLSSEGFGPSTQALLAAAERENPPREDGLNYDIALLIAKSSVEVMLWRLLFECGLGRAVLDWTAPSATEEEQKLAAHQIVKAEEAVRELGVYFDVENAAKQYGISFKEAAIQKAVEMEKETKNESP